MPEDVVKGDGSSVAAATANGGAIGSPPVAPQPERRGFDPRARLRELAMELVRTRNRRLLVEYLQVRRAAR